MSGQGLEFRSVQEADAELLPNLFLRAIQSVYPALEDGAWIDDLRDIDHSYAGGDVLVGVDIGSSAVVAMGGLKRVSDTVAEMKRVAVDPTKQGWGIGRALLAALEARAKQLGFERIVLDTTDGQEAARHLYDKRGYTLVDRKAVAHPSGNQFDTYFYEKELHALSPQAQKLVGFMQANPELAGYCDDLTTGLLEETLPHALRWMIDESPLQDEGGLRPRAEEEALAELADDVKTVLDLSGKEWTVILPTQSNEHSGYTFFRPSAIEKVDSYYNPGDLRRLTGFDEDNGQPLVKREEYESEPNSTLVRLQSALYQDINNGFEVTSARWGDEEFREIVNNLLAKGLDILHIRTDTYHNSAHEFLVVVPTDDPEVVKQFIENELPPLPPVIWREYETVKALTQPRYIDDRRPL